MNQPEKKGERWNGARLLGAAALVLLALAAGAVPELAVLDRGALAGGELWRLWTGHLFHASLAHFAFDVSVAALLVLFFRVRWSLLWMPPVISLGLLVCYPDLERYYGLSGVLHALVVWIAGQMALEGRGAQRAVAWSLVLGTLVKATLETSSGASIFTTGIDMGGPVLHGAHLVGAIVGIGGVVGSSLRGSTLCFGTPTGGLPTARRRLLVVRSSPESRSPRSRPFRGTHVHDPDAGSHALAAIRRLR